MQGLDVVEFVVKFYRKCSTEEAQFCHEIHLEDILKDLMEAYYERYSIWIAQWERLSELFKGKRNLFWRLVVCFSCHVESRLFFTARSQCGARFLNLMNQMARNITALN